MVSVYRPHSNAMVPIRNIMSVYYHVSDMEIKVQVRWNQIDPDTLRYLRASSVPANAFAHIPEVLLGSDAWAEFQASQEFVYWQMVNPTAFDIATLLTPIDDNKKDTVMEWSIAKKNTYDSVAENASCPICYEDFTGDTMVSVLPCRHILCIKCSTKCDMCPFRC